jgi:hypothetical protein
LTALDFGCLLTGMNPHILFVIETQTNGSVLDAFRTDMLDETKWPVKDSGDYSVPKIKLSANIWLIPLSNGLPFLGKLVAVAKSHQLACKCLYFEDEPEWICLAGKIPSQSAA